MWCACPTRSPHSPSASSCPKPIPLLNLRPSPAEWAPYPTARTVPRMCERFFCTPAQVPPAFLRQVSAFARTSPSAEPKTRSFLCRTPAFPLCSSAFARQVPTSARTSPAPRRKLAHSRAVLPPPRSVLPSVGTPPPGAKAKPLIGTTRPPAASTPSPHPTQKRPNLTPSRRKNVTLSTHSF